MNKKFYSEIASKMAYVAIHGDVFSEYSKKGYFTEFEDVKKDVKKTIKIMVNREEKQILCRITIQMAKAEGTCLDGFSYKGMSYEDIEKEILSRIY